MLFFCAPPEFVEAEAESVAAELVMAEPVGAVVLAELEAFSAPEPAEPLAERNLEFDSAKKAPPSKQRPPWAPD